MSSWATRQLSKSEFELVPTHSLSGLLTTKTRSNTLYRSHVDDDDEVYKDMNKDKKMRSESSIKKAEFNR